MGNELFLLLTLKYEILQLKYNIFVHFIIFIEIWPEKFAIISKILHSGCTYINTI